MMKKEFEVILNWKQITLLAVSTTVLYGLILYLLNTAQSIEMVIIQAVIYGVSMTLFFIFLFPWFMKKFVGKRIDNIKPELLENEKIEEEIFANIFRGLEGVGGKIFLTNERLIFKSHSLNIQKGQTNIKYSDIVEVEKRKTMKTVDNGIKVITKEKKEYCFVINDRDTQLQRIQKRIA
ncbi:GRAM domain-containing protein [Polaribacter litorisediminis]|uniref:GRAM domain-containing protein n=1 Tax=Polaribacter litorisediminis TaxID=1908341 RepID=UPI001CBBFCE7|nr:GRAM domain-containing protein [Polaribacter litorisediminis]